MRPSPGEIARVFLEPGTGFDRILAAMGFFTLRHVVQAVIIVVFGRHLQGAVRTFRIVKGERPAPILQLFPLTMAVVVYKSFTAPINVWLAIPGLAGFAGSAALFEWSRRSVRGKFFSYACSGDTPEFLLTSGPYAYVRNPFYTSYLLSYAGAAILFPGVVTFSVALAMVVFLVKAARHEEAKFSRSAVSAEYEAYRRRTGMFIPRVL